MLSNIKRLFLVYTDVSIGDSFGLESFLSKGAAVDLVDGCM